MIRVHRIVLLSLVSLIVLAVPTIFVVHHVMWTQQMGQKHTGQVYFSGRVSSRCYWFVRPNNETFETCFDNPPPFQVGMQFRDITYTDDSADLRHFVKAQFLEVKK